jgi:hypothetical protein
MQVNFDRAVSHMVERGILTRSDDQQAVYVNDAIVDGESKGTRAYLFLCALFWHFIDRYVPVRALSLSLSLSRSRSGCAYVSLTSEMVG